MHTARLLFLLVAYLANAEYCKHYPGEISFAYSTTENEDYWFQNYKNAYTAKKGGDAYAIYRRRTIIRHRGHPMPHMNNMNSINEPIFQQQIQQQQVQIAPLPFVQQTVENETEEAEPEKPPLPIWKIKIPRQCKRAMIARIEESRVVDHFELNETHFENTNVTTSSGSSASASTGTPSAYTRTIDITDQSIIPDSWYMACIQVNLVQKGEPRTCDHCTLLKARSDNGRQQFLDFDWVPMSMQNTSAELRYISVDMPFKSAVIRTKIWTKYTNARCHSTPERVVFESKDVIFPEHFLYVDVHDLIGKMAYTVQVDVEFPWKEKPAEILPIPFAIHNYLYSDQQTTTLAKCEDYQGD